ncbi:cyanophycinase [Bacillus sp. RO1]|uniref:cyanophycinase n=1 Tax=Bacillus sp. RO1 TaxID=2722703 RepID=UPI0014571354|nr:cyanophycinase [Bacillus sp. RO1]NLP52939.1 cyanophycinase [Bacillus sp. RO1]
MMKRLFASFVVISFLISIFTVYPHSENVQAYSGSGKVFLIGGALSDSNAEVFNALKTAAGGQNPKIAVLTTGAYDHQAAYDAFHVDITGSLSYQNLFSSYGFQPVWVPISIDNYSTEAYKQSNIDIINSAQVVFFNGGDQNRHATALLKSNGSDTPLMEAIRNKYTSGGVIAGTSAGAHVQSNPMYGGGVSYDYLKLNDALPYSETGFGILPNAVADTHFDARGRLGRILTAVRDLNKTYGYGVDENTALYINGNTATVYGERGVFIIDASQASYISSSHFRAEGFKLHYLTSGDSFNTSTKQVVSTKSLITSPYYSGYYDSRDIFAAYETTKSVTRLVDQTSSYNIGSTRERSPRFSITFSKNSTTKGYYSNQKYTAENVIVDVTW